MAQRMDWSEAATLKLIEIWGDDSIQAQLEGCKRNRDIFEKIALEITTAGYPRTEKQCREKIKKLRRDYKKVKDNNNETGRDRKTFVFFDKLDEILGHRPATQPEHIIDTSAETEERSLLVADASDEDEMDSTTQENPSTDTSREEEQDKDNVEALQEQEQTPTTSERKKQDKREKGTTNVKRKRPTSMIEKAMDVVIGKLTALQEASDTQMYALEEKRMKLDERMMEMEERRWREQLDREDQRRKEQQELEERRRRDERQFQLQMMHMMCQQPALSSPLSFNMFDTGSQQPGPSRTGSMYHFADNDGK